MLHRSFVLRQFTHSGSQTAVFVSCVALAIVTVIALNGFRASVNDEMIQDARALHGGDIIIHSHQESSAPLSSAIAALEKRGDVKSTIAVGFYSVVRAVGREDSRLSSLKVTGPGYPFYGRVELASGRPFEDVLVQGSAIVERALLDRLGLQVGDRLHVGSTILTIRDVVLFEPDRPVNLFAFGPRVFAPVDDLEAMDLIKKGSRIQYDTLIQVMDPQRVVRIADELRSLAIEGQERVDTFRTAESRVKKFFDNFLFFLGLVSTFTLLLSGIGIQSTLGAFLREKERSIAIMKTVGATSRFIVIQFTVVLGGLGMLGTLVGLACGSLLQIYLPSLFRGLIPIGVKASFSLWSLTEGLVLGTVVVGLFAFLPLYRIKDLKPSAIFRKEVVADTSCRPTWFAALVVFLVFGGMVLLRLRDLQVGLWFMGGVAGLISATALLAQAVLWVLKRMRVSSLVVKQASRGLFRPGNATRSIIVTLAASLSILFSMYLIEANIDSSFVRSYPPDAPNVFLLDIQSAQLAEFSEALGGEAEYYPVVRGRVAAINGVAVDLDRERQSKRDNLAREFNLTYRERLLEDEQLVDGKSLFHPDWEGVQVSVLDTVTEMTPMKVGDVISFRVQGVPMEAKVSSIRTRNGGLIQPFFYFVFQESALKDAPQTVFTALRVPREQIASLQNRIVTRFPNVSVIDVTQTVSSLANIMHKLSGITRFFTLFSMMAGLLIVIGSIFATRFDRIRESVYFKILGARNSFILSVFTTESLILGLVSGLLALLLSQVGSWVISARVLGIPYRPFWGASLVMILATMLLVAVVGIVSSLSILKQKPVIFLREHAEE
jgi:putative ABC transport system permease protein